MCLLWLACVDVCQLCPSLFSLLNARERGGEREGGEGDVGKEGEGEGERGRKGEREGERGRKGERERGFIAVFIRVELW